MQSCVSRTVERRKGKLKIQTAEQKAPGSTKKSGLSKLVGSCLVSIESISAGAHLGADL